MSDLSNRAVKLYHQFLSSLLPGVELPDALVADWRTLELSIGAEMTMMNDDTKTSLSRLTNNVLHQAEAFMGMRKVMKDSVEELSESLRAIALHADDGEQHPFISYEH